MPAIFAAIFDRLPIGLLLLALVHSSAASPTILDASNAGHPLVRRIPDGLPHNSKGSLSIPLLRKPRPRNIGGKNKAEWARQQADYLTSKYDTGSPSASDGSSAPLARRAAGTSLLTNQNTDSTYYGTIAVGTPPVPYNVILDTGSSDLWLAVRFTECERQSCSTIESYDAGRSSSFVNSSQPFSIRYGSGDASGWLGRDVVRMAGFEVKEQTFAACDSVSPKMLSQPVSGLMGLAFRGIAASKATPFWWHLAQAKVLDQPLMSFFLTKFLSDQSADDLEHGGSFMLGGVDPSLYQGEIEYIDLASNADTYWLLHLTHLAVQGAEIPLTSDISSFAAIDTGTTLIGGPSSVLNEIFAHVPGSYPGRGSLADYYFYPCDINVTVTIAFGGGRHWTISPEDLLLFRDEGDTGDCVASLFQLNLSGSSPRWIFGDTFLKNVYSVFRYDPPAVGFAELSEHARSLSDVTRNAPLPTTDVSVTVQGSAPTRLNIFWPQTALCLLLLLFTFQPL